MKVNQDFLFGCSTGVWGRGWGERKGIVELHAYSVLKAREVDGVRLVLLKNPWGKHEWKGPWSDGSSMYKHAAMHLRQKFLDRMAANIKSTEEWTAEWLQKLDHKFGDDGSFWISYDDLLRKYQAFDRTRLFGPEWKVSSIWTTLDVAWTLDYHDTKFAFSLARSGPVVIVFSQLDERYFKGLEGQYRFELSFRVHQRTASSDGAGAESANDYVVRSQNYYRMNRSVNVELDLAAGEYVVVVKIDAQRNERVMPVEGVVRAHAKDRREKLLRIGLAYDVAHSKGKIVESAEEKEARAAYEKRRAERERRRVAARIRENRLAAREAQLRAKRKDRKTREKAEARAKAKADRKAARRAARAKAEEQEQEKEKGKDGERKEDDDKDLGREDTNEKAPQCDGTNVVVVVDDKASQKKITPTQNATDGKDVTIDAAAEADIHAEDSISSAENGEQTPASSAASAKNPAEVDEALEGEEYVTAAEDEQYATAAEEETKDKPSQESSENNPAPSTEEEPSTPKPAPTPTSVPNTNEKSTSDRVDVGVQTGPQLPFPPPPSPIRRGAPPPHNHHHHHHPHHGPYMPPPPGRYGPPRRLPPTPGELSRMPPELRGPYIPRMGPPLPLPPPLSDSELSTSDSESSDASDAAAAEDISEVSEDDIDRWLADQRTHAARQAAALAAAKAQGEGPPGGNSGPAAKEEPLDEFEKDPWNAVGVFGLRVYYKVPEAGPEKKGEGQGSEEKGKEKEEEEEGVRLRVERPNPFVWDESSDEEDADDEGEGEKGEKGEKEESKVLDVDDSAKDAVGEQPPTPSPEGHEGHESQMKKEEETAEVKKEVEESTPEGVKTDAEAAVNVKIEEESSEKQSAGVDVKKEEN